MLGAIIGDTIRTQWYMLERFWNAQERDFECALQENKKRSKTEPLDMVYIPSSERLGE